MRTEGVCGAVGFSHLILRQVIRPGDRVIDATCGRGQDCLFLAGLVGSSGEVWAFDVQEKALAETAERLLTAGCSAWVELVHAGHESLTAYVREPVRAVVFNLGYLPGNSAGLVTRPETTRTALDQSLELLLPGGMVVVAIYTGHQGGDEEAACIESWASRLSSREFNVWKSRQLNRSDSAPYVVIVEKVLSGK